MALNFPFKNTSSDLSKLQDKTNSDSEFSKAIGLFTTQRNKLGISLEELSSKTKISRNVLIAIEKGWKDYLPETTYLKSMLKMIEVELNLDRGSLNGFLDKKIINNSLYEFKFINIDFLNSWFGSLLYFIFMLLSILAINSQQKYLLKINSTSTETILKDEMNRERQNIINSQE
tara:strand:- start:382 stop:903 length:522 start_codon:yes stop_codon:yes gene_type:complete